MYKGTYNIGLDIGTSSIGFAATDDSGKPIRVKGKTVIGVRLFEEGKTAEERRGFRTTRRRLARRKWRVNLLNQIFDPYIAEVDSTFLARLKESNLSKRDQNKQFRDSLLFPERTDSSFYEDYPTMYHLRHALMTKQQKFDIREIYLAMHHIVKYRGNFLNNSKMDVFDAEDIDLKSQFERLNQLYAEIDGDNELIFDIENAQEIEGILLNKSLYKLDRQKQLAKMLVIPNSVKTINKINTKIATHFSKAILGYKFNLDVILKLEVEDAKEWSIQLDDEESDSKLDSLVSGLDQSRLDIIEVLKDLYSAFALNEIVENGQSLSKSMIEKYENHHQHLKMLKTIIANHDDRKKAKALQNAYNQYVGKATGKTASKDDFYKAIQKSLDQSDEATEVKKLIELDQFMPKQRTSQNGVIPRQLHQKELDQIIENQAEYYPFLKEPNPNEKRKPHAKYKLDELVAFKIPYYVGPLITPEEQAQESGKSFAWMKRKEDGVITPWNFDEKVDRMESANRFIRRMTTKDTYLLGEDVLPDESMIYQRFKVLNELNNVKIDGKRLTVQDKQDIFDGLFKKIKTIKVKQLQNYLHSEKNLPKTVTITGLSDPDRFNSSLSTYIDFKKIFGKQVDDLNRQNDFEKIIEWSTIFEDRGIFEEKLHELEWLSEDQIKKILSRRYRGWGRLSAKLLTGLWDDDQNSILDELWNTNDNFMQIQSREEFAKLILEANKQEINPNDSADIWNNIESTLNEAYTSPQNKKAIRQVIKVVQDIEKAVGHAPEKIAIEFTRSAQANPRRTQRRQNQLADVYKNTAKEIIDSGLMKELNSFAEDKRTLSDKYYLYFTQLGTDVYTGEKINIDEFNKYEIDHILPQAFIKDDSLDNRVLTGKAENNGKSNNVPVKLFGAKMGGFWRRLVDNGLISKRKYRNLTTDPDTISKYTKQGFIQRQLVETSQVIKLTANILKSIYDDETKIIEVPAKMTHQMRDMFDLVKVREVNDYHHAFDAYLTIFVGNYLFKRYPKLRPYFVYGDFKKFNNDVSDIRNFNFLHDLNDGKSEKVVDQETGEILWSNVSSESIEAIKKIYNYKFMLTSHETFTRQGAMFDQTIYPSTSNKKLIPIKEDKPTDLYGGYSGNKDAYMAIVAIEDKKGTKYKVVGIPVRAADELKRYETKSRDEYLTKLHDVLKPQFTKVKTNRKTGEQTEVIDDFRVIVEKVNYRQIIHDGNVKFMLGSASYKYNVKQLVLSESAVKIIKNDKKHGQVNDNNLIDVYDEILGIVNQTFDLYDVNGFREKLNKNRDKFINLPIENIYDGNKLVINGKREILLQILIGLHADPSCGNLKPIGFTTPFGKLQVHGGITLAPESILIHQSPAGLFERRIKLSDL